VKEIQVPVDAAQMNPADLLAVGNDLFFTCFGRSTGRELWIAEWVGHDFESKQYRDLLESPRTRIRPPVSR